MYCIEAIINFEGNLSDTQKSITPRNDKIRFDRFDFPDVDRIWSLLSSTHPEYSEKLVVEEYLLLHTKYSEITGILKEQKVSEFSVSFENQKGTIEFGNITDYKVSRIRIKDIVINDDDSEKWLKPFIDNNTLIQARIYNSEYDFWQNAHDPLQFTANNRSYKGLPMKSNNLPPPLKQKIIDTSMNPGRWGFKQGYIEFIGSTMWFNSKLLLSLGIEEKNLDLNKGWLAVEKLSNNVFKLKVTNTPFHNDDKNSKEIQNKLRSFLYNETTEINKKKSWWPFFDD